MEVTEITEHIAGYLIATCYFDEATLSLMRAPTSGTTEIT